MREQVAFNTDGMENALRDLVENGAAKEARFYPPATAWSCIAMPAQPDHAIDWLAQYHHLPRKDIEPYLYTLPHEQAVKHSFRCLPADWTQWCWRAANPRAK